MSTEEDGLRLVELARATIAHELGRGPRASLPEGPWFEQPGATFVTITRDGRLHGCIGTLAARRPLVVDVQHNALAAAFEDPRSEPYRAEWLPRMGVEVTLLGPLQPIEFSGQEDLLAKVVPHEDGLVLRYGVSRGTFLPQVWDSLPDPREFLDELKQKAGLSRDFWADGVEVFRFRVQKWGGRNPYAS
jgi:hypothetical protein